MSRMNLATSPRQTRFPIIQTNGRRMTSLARYLTGTVSNILPTRDLVTPPRHLHNSQFRHPLHLRHQQVAAGVAKAEAGGPMNPETRIGNGILMRHLILAASLASVLVIACPALASNQSAKPAPRSASACNPEAPGALIARPSDLKTTHAGRTLLAAPKLRLAEAIYVKGPCVHEIVSFVAGNARLRSGKIFVVWGDGKVQLHPPQGLIAQDPLPAREIDGLPGYRLFTIERLGLRRTPAGERVIFLGLFKGKSDYLIARFDVLNGKPSRNAEVLIRATSPISAMDFLPAPDTADGTIGFVQHAGPNQAWLYAYAWHHGDFAPLPN